jgi:hypothetical protein
MISFYLYKGKNKNFTREQLSSLFFPFALFVESTTCFSEFDHFLKFVNKTKFETKLLDTRFRASILCTKSDKMIFIIDPIVERIIEHSWNGKDESLVHIQVESKDDCIHDFLRQGPYIR